MKDQFLELQILSEELWSEVKAIRHNSCNKKRAVSNIERIITKIKKLDLDSELKLLKEIELPQTNTSISNNCEKCAFFSYDPFYGHGWCSNDNSQYSGKLRGNGPSCYLNTSKLPKDY